MSTNTILATTPLVSTNYLLRATGTTIGNSLIFDNGTNVGIGTTNPLSKLSIGGDGYADRAITAIASGTDFAATIQQNNSSGNGLQIFTNNANWGADSLKIQSTSSTQFIIKSSGNVGIGTSTTSGKLTLYQGTAGNVLQSIVSNQGGSTRVGINFCPSMADSEAASSPAQASIYATDYNYSADIIFANKLTGAVGNALTERMRISSGGELCIATTTASWTDPNRGNITVGGATSAIYAMQVGGVTRSYFFCNALDTIIDNASGTGTVTVLNGSGGVKLDRNATSWTSNSDERLKNINSIIENALDKILTLRAVNFTWKTDDTNAENLGLIAQDVEKVFPQVVNKSKLSKSINTDNDNDIEYLGVKYTELIPVLVKAIQEQNQTIQELSNRLIKLESK